MEIPEYKRGDIVILRLRGRLDSLTSNKLEEKFLALLDKGRKKSLLIFPTWIT